MSGKPRTTSRTKKYKQSSGKSKYKSAGAVKAEDRRCTFFVYLTFSKSVCTIRGIAKGIRISEFKERLVLTCGVPLELQRLQYLDSCELNDDDTLNTLNVVNNATFRLSVWNDYQKLLHCVHGNDLEGLLTCLKVVPKSKLDHDDDFDETAKDGDDLNKGAPGSDESDSYENENESSSKQQLHHDYARRGEIALFAASQLGRLDIIKELLELVVDINCKTSLGYTPLHAATANGSYDVIDYLLENGCTCDTKSDQAKKAIYVAELYGFPESERHLRSYEWQIRAKQAKPAKDTPLMMHQQFDSKTPTWIDGEYSARYVCSTLPLAEYSGTGISAPKIKPPKTPQTRNKYKVLPPIGGSEENDNNEQNSENEGKDKEKNKTVPFEGYTFDTWLTKKKQQKEFEKQEAKEMESILQREREEKEKSKKTKKLIFHEEQKKRSSRVNDDYNNGMNKVSMHDEHKYLPNYSTSITRIYMNALLLEDE